MKQYSVDPAFAAALSGIKDLGIWGMGRIGFKDGSVTAQPYAAFNVDNPKVGKIIARQFVSNVLRIAAEVEKQEFEFDGATLSNLSDVMPELYPDTPSARIMPFVAPVKPPQALNVLLSPNPPAAKSQFDFAGLLGNGSVEQLPTSADVQPWNNDSRTVALEERLNEEWPREQIGRQLLALKLPTKAFSLVTKNTMMFVFDPVDALSAKALQISDVVPPSIFERLRARPQ